jgi:hypothetical protein
MAKKQKNPMEKILNYTLRTLKMNEICPNFIDGVVISIEEEKIRLDLPSNMSSDIFRKWLEGKGGVFSQDISRFLKKKPSGTYILMEGGGERTIIRLIEDEEFIAFESRKLTDGKVKDKAYMTLRTLKEEESLTTSSRYIEENSEVLEPEPLDIPHQDIPQDSEGESMQLFTN